jgi:hypothetical protein
LEDEKIQALYQKQYEESIQTIIPVTNDMIELMLEFN